MPSRKLAVAVTVALALAARAAAAPTVPYRFTPSTPARASEVNANFSAVAQAIADVVPAGTLLPFAGDTLPPGFLFCDGREVDQSLYPTLFAVLGDKYGAASVGTKFRLPDLRSRIPVGAMQGADLGAGRTARTLGATGGAETVTLTSAQSGLPAHSHTGTTAGAGAHVHTLPIQQPAGSSLAWYSPGGYSANGIAHQTDQAADHAHAFTTGANGAADASSAHANMPPFLVVNWIIKY